ncbi:esterase [Kitasatospora sp. MMS16-BH015]|uniref:alpha/beta hydrolase n=1 Tax=Kitasatospora sp. MMS16-BH015 TaxID=2018025 RepID=UPI000CA1DDD7|nr:alpha/beta hydrolase-fold protein [Kitasatospora sp. MMS16-BH015]AUG81174.1 esterase [Kitasatospora sp. MMS16-BH015]
MGLTSHKVLLLAALITVALVAGTLWIWPRLAVRSWPALFARLATVLLTQLALVCTLGLLANDYFAFYSSWGDLLGTDHGGRVTLTTTAGGGPGPAAGVVPLPADEVHGPGAPGQAPDQVGRLDHVRLPGAVSGLSTDGYVYLPPQYFQGAYAHKAFPALVVLTGFPGDAKNLVTKLDYPASLLRLLRAGGVTPVVLVLLRPSPSMPRDSECEDVPGGPQALTYFTTDVPAAVRASYRVLGGAHAWAAMGDSTGGYCALKFALTRPEVYASAVSLSGYFRAAEDVTTGDLFAGSPQRRQDADLTWRLTHLPQPAVSLLLADSRQDGSTYADSTAFAGLARPPLTVDRASVPTGGHNFTTWTQLIPPALQWLSPRLTPPG